MALNTRVSVVIPVYNRWDYLIQAIRSVLDQSPRPEEVLIVDDGSTEGSSEVAENLDPSVRVLRQEHRGRSAARNCGLRSAEGELIAFLDSDDVWVPGKLARQLDLLARCPKAGMVAGHVAVIDRAGEDLPDGTSASRRAVDALAKDGCSPEAFIRHSGIFTSTVVVRREVLEDVGVFDEEIEGNEDLELWLRIARKWKVIVTPWPPTARYRVHGSNTGSLDMARGTLLLARRHLRGDPPLGRQAQSLLLVHQARAHRTLGDERQARHSLARALATAPLVALKAGVPRLVAGTLLFAPIARRLKNRTEDDA